MSASRKSQTFSLHHQSEVIQFHNSVMKLSSITCKIVSCSSGVRETKLELEKSNHKQIDARQGVKRKIYIWKRHFNTQASVLSVETQLRNPCSIAWMNRMLKSLVSYDQENLLTNFMCDDFFADWKVFFFHFHFNECAFCRRTNERSEKVNIFSSQNQKN